MKILPKIKFFLWKLIQGGIPVKARLVKRGWQGSQSCDLCPENSEDNIHAFFFCSYATQVWTLVESAIGIRITPAIIFDLLSNPTQMK